MIHFIHMHGHPMLLNKHCHASTLTQILHTPSSREKHALREHRVTSHTTSNSNRKMGLRQLKLGRGLGGVGESEKYLTFNYCILKKFHTVMLGRGIRFILLVANTIFRAIM